MNVYTLGVTGLAFKTPRYAAYVCPAVRKTKSRAKEFDLVFSFLSAPKILSSYIKLNPTGGKPEFEGITFEYGDIRRHLKYLNPSKLENPFKVRPKFVCHLDNVNADRKRQIETSFGLSPDSISSSQVKADLFFVDQEGNPYFVSVKDNDEPSKLGQISREVLYGKASLRGGLTGVDVPQGNIPLGITYKQTALSERKFNNLTVADQRFSFFKKNYPKEWLEIVKKSKQNALDQTRQFAITLREDRTSLIEFLGVTLAGNLKESKNFYILLGKQTVNFNQAMSALKTMPFEIEIEEHRPRQKTSVIIWLNDGKKKYGLTKIEPSFEGEGLKVDQTKGIIFHFQQYGDSSNCYKKLLLDITK
jgi:hypothetical protein